MDEKNLFFCALNFSSMPQVNDEMRKKILELIENRAKNGLSSESVAALKAWLERTGFEVKNVLRLRDFLAQAGWGELELFNRTKSLPISEKALFERSKAAQRPAGKGKHRKKKPPVRLPGQPTGRRSQKRR